MPNIFYVPDSTWTDLDQKPIFQKFMKEYISLLQKRLKKVQVQRKSHSSTYYTCGQPPIPITYTGNPEFTYDDDYSQIPPYDYSLQ